MKADVFRRWRTAGAAWLALPAAALLAGCEPGAVGGYPKVVYRDQAAVPQAAYPDPPPVTPGASAGQTQARIVARNLPQGVTQAMVDQGQDQFGSVCAACHGQAGAGGQAAPALNDAEWLNIGGQYPEIVAIINSGVPSPKQYSSPMPPKGGGGFDDAQVRALAAYVFALSHQGGRMSRRPESDDTFQTVEGRYEEWNRANPRLRGPSALKVPVMSDAAEKTVGMAVGFGAGALLLVLAVITGLNAGKWGGLDRSGAQVAYAIAAFFLTLAGLGALGATWNHVFRVIPGEAPHHH